MQNLLVVFTFFKTQLCFSANLVSKKSKLSILAKIWFLDEFEYAELIADVPFVFNWKYSRQQVLSKKLTQLV